MSVINKEDEKVELSILKYELTKVYDNLIKQNCDFAAGWLSQEITKIQKELDEK